MVQQLDEVPPNEMFRADYPYRASGSVRIRKHFEDVALRIIQTCSGGPDGFVVEIGSNDGVMLKTLTKLECGIWVSTPPPARPTWPGARCQHAHGFLQRVNGRAIRAEHGPAHLIYSANTISHISYLDSIFRGVDSLLEPNGLFVFEDRYLGTSCSALFDQIYDEHIYLFSVRSVQATAARFGFELIDTEHFPMHGGSIRYWVARAGTGSRPPPSRNSWRARKPTGLPRTQRSRGSRRYRVHPGRPCRPSPQLAGRRPTSCRVRGDVQERHGMNYCHIGSDLLSMVCDSTPEKQGRLTPGSKFPCVRPKSSPTPTPTMRCSSRGTTPRRSCPRNVSSMRRVAGGSCTRRRSTSSDVRSTSEEWFADICQLRQ